MESTKTSVPLTSEQQMNVFRFRDKMSLLNSEFIIVLGEFHKKMPSCDFTATLKSYMDNVKELRGMYKMEVATENGNKVQVKSPEKTNIRSEIVYKPIEGRKVAKARRKNDNSTTSSVFAASSPAVSNSVPKFGDISMIPKETPAPLEKANKPEEPAPQTARKRAIRGGGPLGGSESVVFRSGTGEAVSEVQIPVPNIKFPEPSKDFWTSKKASGTDDANKSTGSLFAFLGNGESTSSPAKFSGFAFGKKADEKEKEKEKDEEKTPSVLGLQARTSENSRLAFSSFGAAKTSSSDLENKNNSESSKPAISFPTFGKSVEKKDDTPKVGLSFPSFGKPAESKDSNGDAPKVSLSFPSFGKAAEQKDSNGGDAPKIGLSFSSFTSSTTTGSSLTAPSTTGGLTFGSGGSLFGNLAQKATENAAKAAEGDDEGEYVPPKVEAVENAEPDAVFSKKVSVFKYNGKDYQKLGVGMLHIKQSDGKDSVLIRAATTTGTVWLNAGCNAAMKVTKVDEKGEKYRLTCPLTSSEMGTFLIRFGVAEQAKEFADKIKELAK